QDANVKTTDGQIANFRANLIVSGQRVPFEEFLWSGVSLGENVRLKSKGGCTRCTMINIDQNTGRKTPTLFQALSQHKARRINDQNVRILLLSGMRLMFHVRECNLVF